jgi:hypothetical protein
MKSLRHEAGDHLTAASVQIQNLQVENATIVQAGMQQIQLAEAKVAAAQLELQRLSIAGDEHYRAAENANFAANQLLAENLSLKNGLRQATQHHHVGEKLGSTDHVEMLDEGDMQGSTGNIEMLGEDRSNIETPVNIVRLHAQGKKAPTKKFVLPQELLDEARQLSDRVAQNPTRAGLDAIEYSGCVLRSHGKGGPPKPRVKKISIHSLAIVAIRSHHRRCHSDLFASSLSGIVVPASSFLGNAQLSTNMVDSHLSTSLRLECVSKGVSRSDTTEVFIRAAIVAIRLRRGSDLFTSSQMPQQFVRVVANATAIRSHRRRPRSDSFASSQTPQRQ